MPKLFVPTGIFHPESGGPATYLHELLPELQARGWEVRLQTYGGGETRSYPYPVTRIPRRALPLRMAQYQVAAFTNLNWADLIYINALDMPLLGGKVRRVTKIVGDPAWERAIRKGWIPATEDIDDFQNRPYSGAARAQQNVRNRFIQAMDAVIVPSEYLKRMVMGWGVPESRLHVIYNALPTSSTGAHHAVGMTAQAARLQVQIPPDVPAILTAARLTPWKGIAHLIQAVSRIPELRLYVAGDGELLAAHQAEVLAAGVQNRVIFLGKVSRERMPIYMRAVDYVALYSGYEGLSHTLLESLREGTPVIASDKGGNPEVVQHEVNGLLVPYVDVDALTAALQRALQPGVRTRLAANWEIGMERFQFKALVAQTDAVLRMYL
jgi:glycosyltransferase involved in cell wall biosynthesis